MSDRFYPVVCLILLRYRSNLKKFEDLNTVGGPLNRNVVPVNISVPDFLHDKTVYITPSKKA